MLPILQAEEIKHSVTEYLKATFNFQDKNLKLALNDFLFDKRKGMFKGPFMQVRLPFEKTDESDHIEHFIKIKPGFDPYRHQFEAFKRLSTRNGNTPEPLILTTGTGSGKTESFLFPLLDYCYQHRDTPGIKAIILYPMNALATDQARRLAEEINNFKDEDGNYILRGQIRAGLFIGEGKAKGKTRSTRMEPDGIIEDRQTITSSPPDIILTNFKMLDFALMRAEYNGLWRHNYNQPDLLKFLVLDELHTYDGAKGSDVANLIRRLKLKLKLPHNQIVPIGTSATMGGGEKGKEELVQFFSDVFGVHVTKDAVVEEQRLEAEEFFASDLVMPDINLDEIEDCRFNESDEYGIYINRQLAFWGYADKNRVELGELLKTNEWLYYLLQITQSNVSHIQDVLIKWGHKTGLDNTLSNDKIHALFASLLTLMSYAKEQSGTKQFPFLYLQITYWLRSLNRILRKVQPTPVFEWESEINTSDPVLSLPPYYCRECGASGWIAIKKEQSETLEQDLARTRQLFMADSQNKNIYFISSLQDADFKQVFAEDYNYTGDPIDAYIDPHSLILSDKKLSVESFKIFGVRVQDQHGIQKICPHCNTVDNLSLIGTGIPTIESVATAQVLASSMDDTPDKQRKLLAFTNGVQDAAHQAGFIENRNFRFGMRHAIQSTINLNKTPVLLPDFYKQFENHWKQKADENAENPIEAYYFKFLPPDCDSRISIDDYKDKSGKFPYAFDREFSNRISWELWSEFTYNATTGRTLERSAASAICFDTKKMTDVFEQMKDWLKANALDNRIEKEDFLKFLNGFLHRLRQRGGVDHTYLKSFRTGKTNYYLITQNINKSNFLIKNFGKHTRLPKFITLERAKNTAVFDVIQIDKKHNWYSTFFRKSFPLINYEETNLINDFYKQLLDDLESNNLLDKKNAEGVLNYGLSEDSLAITNEVKTFICSTCGHEMNVGVLNETITSGMSCLQYRCPGKYKLNSEDIFDYYRMVYNRGRSLRIFANDHTGLIDRNKREELENDFKKRPSYKSTNVLVATSTLEMGIDIGDLNITFNSSLPPETSNYLQRVGRAGRSSGTSLILNMAGRDQHDLYYYKDPMEMMAGEVRTPACYLRAKDILRRHFMAYCFDTWASSDPDSNRIPFVVKRLALKSLPIDDNRFVFNQIAKFIELNKDFLFEQFIGHFKEAREEDPLVFDIIKQDLLSGVFITSITRIHFNLLEEIKYYESKRKKLESDLKKLPITSPEALILKKEKKALSGAIYNINKRNVVEYLTNIGILPNYAFPETGVSLNAQVVKKNEKDGVVSFKSESFGDIIRPSSSAISELAPANIFYSQGHMLEMHGLEIFSREEYEIYRLCSNCDEMQLDIDVPSNQSVCPKCGHNSWGATSNKKTIVRLKSVISVNDSDKSKITDTKDDRDRKFYQKSIHIKTDPTTSKGARILKRIPFGIEFFSKTKYIEINTGIKEDGFFGTSEIEINGTNFPEVGFVVCQTCGKTAERAYTQYELSSKKKSYHFGYCSNKKQEYKGHSDDYFKEIYLYREFYTEAIKILLPVQDFRTEERVSIFKAGLFLGLKNYYKGHPDHVHIREYEEFNKESNRKDRYLIMYETIPGGTGYLSKLFDPIEFTKMLQIAYDKIRLCTCKDEGKDGCYKCIYTYGNQYERDILSRNEAENLFQNIIEKAGEWNVVDSLKGIDGFANSEESDLEDRFIELLSEKFEANFYESSDPGEKKYTLNLEQGDCKMIYEIWPQNLGNYLKGVNYTTTPDFVFKCVSISKNDQFLSFSEIEEVKDIVVYLDGYSFHATKEHPRVPSDMKIRNAIVQSGKYHLWVFSWDDIISKAKLKAKDAFNASFNENIAKQLCDKHSLLKEYSDETLMNGNSFDRFNYLLLSPINKTEISKWSSLLLFSCQHQALNICFSEDLVETFIDSKKIQLDKGTKNKPNEYALSDNLNFTDEMSMSIFIHLQTLKTKGFALLNDTIEKWEKDNWEFFWQVYNLSQFHQIEAGFTSKLVPENKSDSNLEILTNFEESLHDIVRQLIKAGIEFNTEYDFDLLHNEEIMASAELGSHDKKFFINPFSEEDQAYFIKNDYSEYTLENFDLKNIK
ncbi:DEAD/DEAH box helicase [Labilibaculum antarcticum]|uniref:DEAD/DEAH box helicase domain-containing protein n=1 Tax=Labilibaculum antarcticum TaxID=1717717 RepID=A0A1Y1CQ17_9BACT|nr:DEAD/DEAH box helicase [Labilibaculum antarcticum]BAX82354.1 DEAD/DEAH box helicase domain-containing protein [Labilibaculum antarcticum]